MWGEKAWKRRRQKKQREREWKGEQDEPSKQMGVVWEKCQSLWKFLKLTSLHNNFTLNFSVVFFRNYKFSTVTCGWPLPSKRAARSCFDRGTCMSDGEQHVWGFLHVRWYSCKGSSAMKIAPHSHLSFCCAPMELCHKSCPDVAIKKEVVWIGRWKQCGAKMMVICRISIF